MLVVSICMGYFITLKMVNERVDENLCYVIDKIVQVFQC